MLFILVLLVGPKKLATLAEQLGRSTRKIKDQLDSAKAATGLDEVERSLDSMKSLVNNIPTQSAVTKKEEKKES